MDLSLLPQEIFEEVALYLNISEILSCCLVGIGWRNAVNNNRVWNHLCLKKFDIQMNNSALITNRNYVEPSFVVPENDCNRLSDICIWRIRFMQEVHISKNWRRGRYVSEKVTKINVGEILESEGNMIIVPNNERRFFTSMNVEDDYIVKQTVPYSLNNMLASFFKLCNDKIVLVQCTLLQVFTRSENNDFDLKYRFLFNKTNEESLNIPTSSDLTEWYESTVGLYPCDITVCCDHDGKYFVGVIQEGDLNNARLHIWDLSVGIKCREQILPRVNESVTDIHFTLHNSKVFLFITVIQNERNCSRIYCLNLKTFTYTNLFIRFDYNLPLVLVRSPYLLTSDTTGHNISLWSCTDGVLVYKMFFSKYYLNLMTLQFASSFLLICGNSSCLDMVRVFNIKTLKTVYELFTNFRIISLMLIRAELMLIRGALEFGVWDITTGTKLHTINEISFCRHVIWTNYNCSKVALETESNELYLFRFW
ncbi:uncharacterized protein [Rhodnius prolixus]|uniref:F-box domain-containing protein n=1 Tax=Rhodnius prolixus TaxID=13249 RepID=A0A4P6D6N9_RHOPR